MTGVTFGRERVVGVWVTRVVTGVMTGRGGVVVVVGIVGWVVVGTVAVSSEGNPGVKGKTRVKESGVGNRAGSGRR